MHPDIERHRLFSRRATILVGGQALMFAVLTWRLYDLQIVRGKRFKTLAEENRISLRLTIPPRGLIVDRTGREIASNQQEFRAVIVAERIKNIRHTLDVLANIIQFDRIERARILKEIRRRPRFVPVAIRRSLSWEQVAQVEVNAPDLPGVYIEQGLARRYPYGQAAAHVIGYVAAVEEKEQKGDPLLQLPDFRIGKNGIERTYDLALRGHAGARQVEINAHGRVIRELSRKRGKPGNKVVLTIDAELQKLTAERLKDVSGAAVVMDIHTGDVLALASTPAFDPEVFGEGIDRKLWRKYLSNPKAPMTNKAIAGQYAPGSTFKMVVALAALEAGVITPYTGFVCPGFKHIGNARFHCWRRGGHGMVNLHQGIKQSCDVYFYNVALKVGVDKIAAMAHRLGLGELVGVDLPGERKGSIPSTAWKMKAMKQPWYPGETLVAGIGQGYVLSTPLQLAVMTARIANGGFAVTPRLSRDDIDGREIGARAKQTFKPIGVSKKSLDLIKKAMIGVVNEPGGTAYWTRITEKGQWMAGKTGTSQVRRITKAERARGVRKNKDLPWELRDHALFVAFAPHDAPRFACAVIVEHGGGGSRAAAPVAKDILLETQKRLNPTAEKKDKEKKAAAAKPGTKRKSKAESSPRQRGDAARGGGG
ncbi:MAG: penicillin-binding protein 2 [Alphaproteobacteria bacterium]|nr:penicillin-binding protein 2 [Alphaproteobacteria bacterium]